jgi:hypothetical protein
MQICDRGVNVAVSIHRFQPRPKILLSCWYISLLLRTPDKCRIRVQHSQDQDVMVHVPTSSGLFVSGCLLHVFWRNHQTSNKRNLFAVKGSIWPSYASHRKIFRKRGLRNVIFYNSMDQKPCWEVSGHSANLYKYTACSLYVRGHAVA